VKRMFGFFGNLNPARGSKVSLLIVVACAMIGGFSMIGCASDPDVNRGGWSEYSFLPSRDFVVVGTVVARNTMRRVLLDELMGQAFELGAHDIINVRVGPARGNRIRLATAVAIRYTNNPSGGDAPRITVVIHDMASYTDGLSYTITTQDE